MSEARVANFPARSGEGDTPTRRLTTWLRDRADRRLQAEDESQRVLEIKWRWRQACEITGLGRMIFTPSGPTVTIPMIGQVSLGTPTTFTVRPQPGQLAGDFQDAGPRIATAMGVAGVRVRPLAGEWLVIELHEATPGRGVVVPLQTGSRTRGHRRAAAA